MTASSPSSVLSVLGAAPEALPDSARAEWWRVKMVQRADTLVAWLADSRASLVILAVPTAAILWFMRSWGMDTPGVSLRPHLPALAIYGGFFLLGWMLSRQRQLISQIARLAPERWILAALGICAIVLLGNIERDPGHPYYLAAHVAYALTYALSMWSLVFLSIGIFERLCSRPNEFVRYVADSSYWMYLIHLPTVLWLQVAVAEVPLPWLLKLAFVAIITILISLLTYGLFVRSTFLGWILNGRRRTRVVAPWVLKWILNIWRGKLLAAWSKTETPVISPSTDLDKHRSALLMACGRGATTLDNKSFGIRPQRTESQETAWEGTSRRHQPAPCLKRKAESPRQEKE